jgi:hypothetical protein
VGIVLFRVSILILTVLCITAYGYFIASAQDNIQRVEVEKKGEGAVMYIEKADGPQDGSEPKTQIFIKSEDGKTVIMDASDSNVKSDKNATGKRSVQGRSFTGGQGQEFNRTMQKEGVSPKDMKKSDARNQNQEKAQNIGKEQGGTPAPNLPQNQQQAKGQGPAPADEGINRYLNVILNKNLFLPLGSGRKEQKPSYVLTGVISNTAEKSNSKAIIEQAGGQNSFYVSTGDTFADGAKVTEINEWETKLDRSGEQMTLKLGEGSRSGGQEQMGGFRGGESAKGAPTGDGGKRGRNRQDQNKVASTTDNFDASQIPPFILKMLEQRGISIEDLKNNPDLREKLKQEFETGIKNGSIQVPDTSLQRR